MASRRLSRPILDALRRLCLLPPEGAPLREGDEAFLLKLQIALKSDVILRAALAQRPFRKRLELAEGAATAQLRRWERWALTRFLRLYREGGAGREQVLAVQTEVSTFFRIPLSDRVLARLTFLRRRAYCAVRYERRREAFRKGGG